MSPWHGPPSGILIYPLYIYIYIETISKQGPILQNHPNKDAQSHSPAGLLYTTPFFLPVREACSSQMYWHTKGRASSLECSGCRCSVSMPDVAQGRKVPKHPMVCQSEFCGQAIAEDLGMAVACWQFDVCAAEIRSAFKMQNGAWLPS